MTNLDLRQTERELSARSKDLREVEQVSQVDAAKAKEIEAASNAAQKEKLTLTSERDTLKGKLLIYEEQVRLQTIIDNCVFKKQ